MTKFKDAQLRQFELNGCLYIVPAEVAKKIGALELSLEESSKELKHLKEQKKLEHEQIAELVLDNIGYNNSFLKQPLTDRSTPFALSLYKRIMYALEGKDQHGWKIPAEELKKPARTGARFSKQSI